VVSTGWQGTEIDLLLAAVVVEAGEQAIGGVEGAEQDVTVALKLVAAEAEVLPGRGPERENPFDGGVAAGCALRAYERATNRIDAQRAVEGWRETAAIPLSSEPSASIE